MPPVTLEIVAPLISGAKHCCHCQIFMEDAGIDRRVQQEELNSFTEEMWQDYTRLSGMVRDLASRYGAQLRITLIDLHTPMGLWKSVRHWVRSYPAFIVNSRSKYVGWNVEAVDSLVRQGGASVSAAA